MSEPNKEFLRRADVMSWLGGLGFSVRQIKLFIKTRKIRKYKFNNNERAYFLKKQIKEEVLNEK